MKETKMFEELPRKDDYSEELLAKLTAAAYDVALRHGLKGPFIDVELDLWKELGAIIRHELTPCLEMTSWSA
jgi:hypothetical protein